MNKKEFIEELKKINIEITNTKLEQLLSEKLDNYKDGKYDEI